MVGNLDLDEDDTTVQIREANVTLVKYRSVYNGSHSLFSVLPSNANTKS